MSDAETRPFFDRLQETMKEIEDPADAKWLVNKLKVISDLERTFKGKAANREL